MASFGEKLRRYYTALFSSLFTNFEGNRKGETDKIVSFEYIRIVRK